MKKKYAGLMAGLVALMLVGCGEKEAESSNISGTQESVVVSSEEPSTEESSSAVTEETTVSSEETESTESAENTESTGETENSQETNRMNLTIYAPDSQISVDGSRILFCDETELTETSNIYVLDETTMFDDNANLDFFEGCESGDTPLTWAQRMLEQQEDHPTALAGVFDISVTDGHIDSLYGIYWWD